MDTRANQGAISLQVAFDVGGTFTDVVISVSDGQILQYKVLVEPDSIGTEVAKCILHAVEKVKATAISGIVHGTTICSNAVLEGKGAITGLITTKGFRDELEIRRLARPGVYDIEWRRTPPLIPRRRRLEVTERFLVNGEEDIELDEDELQEVIASFAQMKVEAIAVCFLHSFTNPAHEQRAVEIVRKCLPDVKVCASYEVLPEIREYERTSTTALNAYLMPVVNRYLDKLEAELHKFHDKPLVMQSNGGLMGGSHARLKPIHMIESGPAAGALAAAAFAKAMHLDSVVAFDMGGTTAKACLIEKGHVSESGSYEVGAGINEGGRLGRGSGYALSVPAFDIAEGGAGGGSLAWLDDGGALRVGPQSAGAKPGPAAYGLGGAQATITDANVVLGYMNPKSIAGGTVLIDYPAATAALATLAEITHMNAQQMALGIHEIANATMSRAIRAVTSERGRDPRDCILIAFGGSGAIHAASLASSIGIKKVYVPLLPGLFCALGLLLADMRHDVVRTFSSKLADTSADLINLTFSSMEENLLSEITDKELVREKWQIVRMIDLRYQGQSSEMTLPLSFLIDPLTFPGALTEIFHADHERSYGYRCEQEPVRVTNLRIRAIASHTSLNLKALAKDFESTKSHSISNRPTRNAFFGEKHGVLPAVILQRKELNAKIKGPAIFDEFDTTIVVPPDWEAELDDLGNIILTAIDQTKQGDFQ